MARGVNSGTLETRTRERGQSCRCFPLPHTHLGSGRRGLLALLDELRGLGALRPDLGHVEGLPLLLGSLQADLRVFLDPVLCEVAAAVVAGHEVVPGLGGEDALAGGRG